MRNADLKEELARLKAKVESLESELKAPDEADEKEAERLERSGVRSRSPFSPFVVGWRPWAGVCCIQPIGR